MFKKVPAAFLPFIFLVPISLPSWAGLILSPSSANCQFNCSGPGSITDTIDQSGLSTNFESGVTDFAAYIGGNPKHAIPGPGNSWVTDARSLPGALDFDLGGIYSISAVSIWNFRGGLGINSFDVFTASLSDFSDGVFAGAFSANENDPISAQVFGFSGIGQYVRVNIKSSHGPFGVGLGEIAFDVSAVPAPATLALISLGLASLGWWRQKKI